MGPRYVLQLFSENHAITNDSATSEVSEIISTNLESIEFKKFFDVCLTKFEKF